MSSIPIMLSALAPMLLGGSLLTAMGDHVRSMRPCSGSFSLWKREKEVKGESGFSCVPSDCRQEVL